MRDQRRRGGAIRTAATISLAAVGGYVLGILFAPASGTVTRRRLAMKVRSLQRTAGRRLGETKRALATRAGRVREAATEWITEHIPHGNGRATVRQRRVRHVAAH